MVQRPQSGSILICKYEKHNNYMYAIINQNIIGNAWAKAGKNF